MFGKLYAKWQFAWETALTTRDENRIERPLEWGFEHLSGAPGLGAEEAAAQVAAGEISGIDAMIALNARLVAGPHAFFDYATPTDFRLEMRHPELFPTNVRPETLAQEREYKRQAEAGELRREPFLRFTSPVRTPYPENDVVNARWYPERTNISSPSGEKQILRSGQDDNLAGGAQDDKIAGAAPRAKQAMIVMPQWNADAFSHNALCTLFNRFGIASLRLSKPYHDVRRPAELERSDYAVSSNVGRTLAACRQAVADIRSCVDWLETQGYEQIGVLGTSLGSCYAFIAAAMDPRIQVCAFNHASTFFGDVVWTGQSTRHIRSSFEHAGLSQDQVRAMFLGISPMAFMKDFAAHRRQTLVVHATYDLTFLEEFSQEVLRTFDAEGIPYLSRVLPCGHYVTGEWPYKYLDGWYLGSFVYTAFKKLREGSQAAA
jgi:dienelactone hydrolase